MFKNKCCLYDIISILFFSITIWNLRIESPSYLGLEECFSILHKEEEEKLKKGYLRRLRLVLGTELRTKNKIQAIGSLAVPALRYSFGIVNWHQKDVQNLDRKTRKLLTIHGQHHPKADVDGLYVSRKLEWRGLTQLEAAYAVEITK